MEGRTFINTHKRFLELFSSPAWGSRGAYCNYYLSCFTSLFSPLVSNPRSRAPSSRQAAELLLQGEADSLCSLSARPYSSQPGLAPCPVSSWEMVSCQLSHSPNPINLPCMSRLVLTAPFRYSPSFVHTWLAIHLGPTQFCCY